MFKKIEIWVLYLTILLALLFAVFFGILVRQELVGSTKLGALSRSALFLAEIPGKLRGIATLDQDLKAKDRFPDKSGFVGESNENEAYLLLSRYDGDIGESIVELVDLKDFSVLHSWNPDINAINEQVDLSYPEFNVLLRDKSEKRNRLYHPLLLKDGSLVFHDSSPLRKVDFCSNLVWQNQEQRFHHSSEIDHGGNFWVPTHMYPYTIDKKYVGDQVEDYRDDAVAKISPDGEILFEKSVSQIFIENDMKYLLFSKGIRDYDFDPIHLNDIQPVFEDGPHWKKGDVFLSLRHQSMIMHYRPSTNELLWVGTGHIYHQHDVDILNDHQIAIFNNNSMNLIKGDRVDGSNEVIVYDFNTGEYSSYLKDSMVEYDVRTTTEGLSEILDNGDLFVEETNYSRSLYFNADGSLRWEHVNRASDGHVYPVTWSRILYKPDDLKMIQSLKDKEPCQ